MSQPSRWLIPQEPPCWGSGEAPLVPPGLRSLLPKIQLYGFSKRDLPTSISLGDLTRTDWRTLVGDIKPAIPSETLLSRVVSVLEEVFRKDPDRFEFPLLESPLDHYANALLLPFETRTWDFLSRSGVSTPTEVVVLISGTFRELRDRIGDMRASLDVAITGQSWLTNAGQETYGFQHPSEPVSLQEAGDLARIRAFRGSGYSPVGRHYEAGFANLMGLRWGIGVANRSTLAECGERAGITRERFRQLEQSAMWEAAHRAWGRPSVLQELHQQIIEHNESDIEISSTRESITREDAVALLIAFGYPESDFQEPRSLSDKLTDLGIRWSDVERMAYVESERLGLISVAELRHHLSEGFPILEGEMFDEVVAAISIHSKLPHGYVYVEQRGSSYLKKWLKKLLAVMGPQELDEAYAAVKRFCKVRMPRLVFPPRSVVDAFLEQEHEFWVVDGRVGLEERLTQELVGVERWVREQIESSTGKVIHRTELWERARTDDIALGTLNVYASYSLLFKPCERGCLTMTGITPSDVSIELASIRAKAIRVPTERVNVQVSEGIVTVVMLVGNDLLDTGVMGTSAEMRMMMSAHSFKVTTGDEYHGHASWSGTQLYGLSQSLRHLRAEPGDKVRFRFSLLNNEVSVELADK